MIHSMHGFSKIMIYRSYAEIRCLVRISQSFYNAFSDFVMKWSAREYVTDTGQASHLE